MPPRYDQPLVSVIVPVRNSQAHIRRLITSLRRQGYRNIEIILVGNVGDRTWEGLPDPLPDNVRIIEIEIPANHKGRDTNFKRNAGAHAARGSVLFFTDQKIIHPENWVEQGLEIMRTRNAPSVAGIMLGTEESAHTFVGRFTDKASIKRNPEFGSGYFLTRENFWKSESLPITATWAMTREAFEQMGGFLTFFTESYEDYSAAWKLISNGGTVWCTSHWVVYHKHREKLSEVNLEYKRSGRGAADLLYYFPECPFALRRLTQVVVVLAALIIMTLMTIPMIIFSLETFVGVAAFGLLSLTIVSARNAITAKHWQGFFFPALTAFFIVVFAISFARRLWEHYRGLASSDKFLQMIVNLIRFGMFDL